jgi:hypothetical protein
VVAPLRFLADFLGYEPGRLDWHCTMDERVLTNGRRLLLRDWFPGNPAGQSFDLGSRSYQMSLLYVALPTLVLAGLTIFCFVVYMLSRCLRCCCHRRKSNVTRAAQPFRRKHIIAVKLFLLSTLLLTFKALVAAMTADSLFSSGITGFFDEIARKAAQLLNLANLAFSLVSSASLQFAMPASQASLAISLTTLFRNEAEVIYSEAHNLQDEVALYDAFRFIGICFCLQFAAVVIATGSAAVWYDRLGPAVGMSIVGFVAVFFAWILWSVHFPLGIVLQDLCQTVSYYVHSPKLAQDPGPVGYIFNCISGAHCRNQLQAEMLIMEGGVARAYSLVNQMNVSLDSGLFAVPVVSNFENAVETSYVSNMIIRNMSIVQQIVGAANVSASFQAMRTELNGVIFTLGQLQVLMLQLQEFFGCAALRALYEQLMNDVCDDVLSSVMTICVASMIMAVCLSVGIIVGLVSHRFLEVLNHPYVCRHRGCARKFRYHFSLVIHERLCRERFSIVGIALNFISKPFVYHVRRDQDHDKCVAWLNGYDGEPSKPNPRMRYVRRFLHVPSSPDDMSAAVRQGQPMQPSESVGLNDVEPTVPLFMSSISSDGTHQCDPIYHALKQD